MTWSLETSQGNESAKIRWELVPYTRGRVLDLGCGPFKAFPHFTGVDNGHHDQQFGWQNRADLIVDTCEKLPLIASQSCDAVFSSHLLEHIKDYKAALREWWRVIKPGGHLCLYLPHKDLYPNIGQYGANPDHKHDFLPSDIVSAMQEIGFWDLVRNETRGDGDEYSFFQVYRKAQKGRTFSCNEPKPEKTAAIVRYGAFGDMMMAASLFPWLKEQGYHITLYCSTYGYDVVKHDPHIDRFIIQDKDQVPPQFLTEFWENERPKYDRFINLSESVEVALLPPDTHSAFWWPDSLRRQRLGSVNYLEFTHALAEVPLPPRGKFYSTAEEKTWARFQRSRMPGPVIVWSLSGSSVHKTWPHMDAVIARIMLEMPDARVVLVGAELDQILQAGWENEPRVLKKAGEWSIRESMAFCEVADVVVGGETGLLNAAGMMDTAKVVFLSHSSPTNLTKHWKNTKTLVPSDRVACWPCHRMHFGFKHCTRDEETGTAACQADIHPSEVWNAIQEVCSWRRAAA